MIKAELKTCFPVSLFGSIAIALAGYVHNERGLSLDPEGGI